MASEHSDIVVLTFDLSHTERLDELRNKRKEAMARYVDPNFEYPANPFAGCVGAVMIGGYFAARRGIVLAHAALTGGMKIEH